MLQSSSVGERLAVSRIGVGSIPTSGAMYTIYVRLEIVDKVEINRRGANGESRLRERAS